MIDDYEDVGAEWTAEWRRLSVATKGWVDARDFSHSLHEVRKAALVADELPTKSNVKQLDYAVKRLERDLIVHLKRLVEVQREVGYFVAAVVQAIALNTDKPDPKPGWQLEQERIEELLNKSDIGLDRTAALYGLDRHRRPS